MSFEHAVDRLEYDRLKVIIIESMKKDSGNLIIEDENSGIHVSLTHDPIIRFFETKDRMFFTTKDHCTVEITVKK